MTLVGLPGCGKSRVGRVLARRLGWEFLDSDAEIARRDGRPVRAIFQESGERKFRALERAVIRELAGRSKVVIATGGGTVLSAVSRRRLCAAGPVFYLQVPVDLLVVRAGAGSRRPVFAGGARAALERMWRERADLYIETGRPVDAARPARAVVEEILTCLVDDLRRQGGARCTCEESAGRLPSKRMRRKRYTTRRANC